MKFTLESNSRLNLIRGYLPQEIRVGEQRLNRSCIVTGDTLIADWAPASFTELRAEHFEPLLALQPELVLLGPGPYSASRRRRSGRRCCRAVSDWRSWISVRRAAHSTSWCRRSGVWPRRFS